VVRRAKPVSWGWGLVNGRQEPVPPSANPLSLESRAPPGDSKGCERNGKGG
jgi:hypothetical protein